MQPPTLGSKVIAACFSLFIFSVSTYGVVQDEPRSNLRAVRVETPPTVDGRLDEAIWQAAPPGTRFIQKQPQEGRPATEETEVRILYDEKNLYLGIMCFDSEPQKIIATEKRRDSKNIYDNDNLQILLDTFHDRRNGYVFVTNPVGARLDLQVRKEGKAEGGGHIPNPNLNINWDGVWKVGSLIHETGWSVEIEIPLVTLRFKEQVRRGLGPQRSAEYQTQERGVGLGPSAPQSGSL